MSAQLVKLCVLQARFEANAELYVARKKFYQVTIYLSCSLVNGNKVEPPIEETPNKGHNRKNSL